jgi:hypothetical protein
MWVVHHSVVVHHQSWSQMWVFEKHPVGIEKQWWDTSLLNIEWKIDYWVSMEYMKTYYIFETFDQGYIN